MQIEIHFHGFFVHIVQEIKVKIFHTALFQLLLKDLSRVVAGAGAVMPLGWRCEP